MLRCRFVRVRSLRDNANAHLPGRPSERGVLVLLTAGPVKCSTSLAPSVRRSAISFPLTRRCLPVHSLVLLLGPPRQLCEPPYHYLTHRFRGLMKRDSAIPCFQPLLGQARNIFHVERG